MHRLGVMTVYVPHWASTNPMPQANSETTVHGACIGCPAPYASCGLKQELVRPIAAYVLRHMGSAQTA